MNPIDLDTGITMDRSMPYYEVPSTRIQKPKNDAINNISAEYNSMTKDGVMPMAIQQDRNSNHPDRNLSHPDRNLNHSDRNSNNPDRNLSHPDRNSNYMYGKRNDEKKIRSFDHPESNQDRII